jgi:hypothetical protein
MSEDRSLLPATENDVFKKSGAVLVNTNALIQKALQKIAAEDRGSVIFRCDDLPLVQGSEEDFETVFSKLLTIILQKKSSTSKLFLHIYCSSEDNEVMATGIKPFTIQFHTNSNPGVNWMQLHEQQINELVVRLQKHSARLVVNQLKNGGCIFSISIFGKSL